MELKRVLAKDSRTALEQINENYGKNTVIIESNKVQGKIEMIVAIDIEKGANLSLIDTNETQKKNRELPNDFEITLSKTINKKNTPVIKDEKTINNSDNQEKFEGLIEREQLRAREIVDLIKRELAGIKEELRIDRELELWNSKPTLDKDYHIFDPIFEDLSMPAGLQALLVKVINDSSNVEGAAESIKKFLLSSMPDKNSFKFSGVHAFAGNPGSGKTTVINEISNLALQQLPSEEVAIISFDDPRLGLWSQFQLMGAKLGVDSFKASNLETLELILRDLSDKKLILIDLPGTEIIENVKNLSNLNQSISFHLIIPNDSSANAVAPLVSSKSIHWTSMFLTRIDCDATPWQLIEVFNKYRLECSYLCKGDHSTKKLIKYTKNELLIQKFTKFVEVFDCSDLILDNVDKISKITQVDKIDMITPIKNDQMIAPEEIMTDPLLAISKLVEKKHNLAKTS